MKDIYKSPDSELLTLESSDFSEKETKKILASWRQLKLLCIVWALFFVLPGIIMIPLIIPGVINGKSYPIEGALFFIAFSSLFGLAIFGSLKLKIWGRILGIILCFFLLFGFPVGTLLGVVGLIAYSRLKFAYKADGAIQLLKLKEMQKSKKKV